MKKNFFDFNPFFNKLIKLNEKLDFIIKNFKNITLSNSLSFEDLFIFYIFLLKTKNFENLLLNTDRLFLSNLLLIKKIKIKYNYIIKESKINYLLINKYIKKYSLNGFYNNIILRKICCYIRKVIPFYLSLNKIDLLITGQRSMHSLIRKNIFFYQFDNKFDLIKSNLLFDWNFFEIFYFLEKFNLLNNFIYELGYFSIGCEPCTRPIRSNENIRSGRWWWENNDGIECGIHN